MAETVLRQKVIFLGKNYMVILFRQFVRGALVAVMILPPSLSYGAGTRQCPANSGAHNQTSQETLRLFAKDPATWKIVPQGGKGLLSFNEKTGYFTFTAAKLMPLKEYSLVRHNEGETVGDLLARGLTDQAGKLILTGTWQLWRGKVWLVPTEHMAQSSGRFRLTVWHPKQILFEEKVLGVVYPCINKK